MPATSPPTSSGSATNEPLCASFQISERVPSLRRSRSRSALPSPAAATWRIALPGPSARPIAASRKPPFSTAMRQASSSSAWRSPARTMSALIALSISSVRLRRSMRRCCSSSAPVFSRS